LVFYAHYDGELHRNRFVVIALMPLFVLSILPLLVSAATQSVAGWVASISSFNALTAGVDLLATGIIVFQIPARAILHNQGWKTYWREPVPLHVS
jgi:DsbC/DsbD-like thiol-disulfide interchange protein